MEQSQSKQLNKLGGPRGFYREDESGIHTRISHSKGDMAMTPIPTSITLIIELQEWMPIIQRWNNSIATNDQEDDRNTDFNRDNDLDLHQS